MSHIYTSERIHKLGDNIAFDLFKIIDIGKLEWIDFRIPEPDSPYNYRIIAYFNEADLDFACPPDVRPLVELYSGPLYKCRTLFEVLSRRMNEESMKDNDNPMPYSHISSKLGEKRYYEQPIL